ncbi:Trm112 family protein [Oricola sp.]|uniref:Trm112 family protein n=1 Tax=Oricola sp. TaxID=1979950 RepID=UPI003BA8A968
MTRDNPDRNTDIDPKLLELLVCPLTKTQLRFDAEAGELLSDAAKLAYPVRGGVPIMLPAEARSLEDAETGSHER